MEIEGLGAGSLAPEQGQPDTGPQSADPLAVFLSDPESHLSDILYLYFRIYKKKLLWSFMQTALARLALDRSDALSIADVGASMGFDALYLLRRLTGNFREPLPCDRVSLSLVEGDQNLIAGGTTHPGEEHWARRVSASGITNIRWWSAFRSKNGVTIW